MAKAKPKAKRARAITGRPRTVLERATADDPIIKALQERFIAAGQPSYETIANRAEVSPISVRRVLLYGIGPRALPSIERIARALGVRIAVVED